MQVSRSLFRWELSISPLGLPCSSPSPDSTHRNGRCIRGRSDTASEVGRYVVKDAAGKKIDHGKYIVIWKKVAGTWKLYRDIWNTSDAPAAK